MIPIDAWLLFVYEAASLRWLEHDKIKLRQDQSIFGKSEFLDIIFLVFHLFCLSVAES